MKTAANTSNWRPVSGYEGAYEVSDDGRVRSLDRTVFTKDGRQYAQPGKALTPVLHNRYWTVGLAKGGARIHWKIHRLVCEAFHGQRPSPDAVVRHLNGNSRDNRAVNVTWGTSAENYADMVRHGTATWINQTHCKRGHEFTQDNTYLFVDRRGGQQRHCRECRRNNGIAFKQRLKRPALVLGCHVCGAEFHPYRNVDKYCSTDCRRASRRRVHRKQLDYSGIAAHLDGHQ